MKVDLGEVVHQRQVTLARVKDAVSAGLSTAGQKRPATDLVKTERKKSRFSHVDKDDEESSQADSDGDLSPRM